MASHEHRSISRYPADRDRDLNRERRADQRRAIAEAIVYLRSRRIEVPEDEPADGIVRLLAAVAQFEGAVHGRGGTLIIDGTPSRSSGRTRFMLPTRRDDETIGDFARRVRELAQRIGDGG